MIAIRPYSYGKPGSTGYPKGRSVAKEACQRLDERRSGGYRADRFLAIVLSSTAALGKVL